MFAFRAVRPLLLCTTSLLGLSPGADLTRGGQSKGDLSGHATADIQRLTDRYARRVVLHVDSLTGQEHCAYRMEAPRWDTSIAAPHFFMLELLLALDDRSP